MPTLRERLADLERDVNVQRSRCMAWRRLEKTPAMLARLREVEIVGEVIGLHLRAEGDALCQRGIDLWCAAVKELRARHVRLERPVRPTTAVGAVAAARDLCDVLDMLIAADPRLAEAPDAA